MFYSLIPSHSFCKKAPTRSPVTNENSTPKRFFKRPFCHLSPAKRIIAIQHGSVKPKELAWVLDKSFDSPRVSLGSTSSVMKQPLAFTVSFDLCIFEPPLESLYGALRQPFVKNLSNQACLIPSHSFCKKAPTRSPVTNENSTPKRFFKRPFCHLSPAKRIIAIQHGSVKPKELAWVLDKSFDSPRVSLGSTSSVMKFVVTSALKFKKVRKEVKILKTLSGHDNLLISMMHMRIMMHCDGASSLLAQTSLESLKQVVCCFRLGYVKKVLEMSSNRAITTVMKLQPR
ncbi:hypothetical protein F2Q69_00021446 [Brassica cretica]|uniref:Uncharacterized protein n=1 Tax=Brassica cretica TaxID=69181 RepID=A0A8S9QDD8_BRACR|nr:hypothetical protein F2Q69_00021446 [Brassica cretica]